MKNNKIIHSVEQGDTISKLIGLYKECADKIEHLEKNEGLDLLPYFQKFAEIFFPDSYRPHFQTESDWRRLERSYRETCGSSPFVFIKGGESNFVGNLKRFKNAINNNLYKDNRMGNGISREVLGKPHYTVFISGVALQGQGAQSSNEKIEANDRDNKNGYEEYLQNEYRGAGVLPSYVHAMEMIERNLHNFVLLNEDIREINLWNIEEIDSLRSVLNVVVRDERTKNGGAFKDEQAASYWKDKFCSNALRAYMRFKFGDDIFD